MNDVAGKLAKKMCQWEMEDIAKMLLSEKYPERSRARLAKRLATATLAYFNYFGSKKTRREFEKGAAK